MKTKEEWEELWNYSAMNMEELVEAIQRDAWASATKAQIRRDKFKMLGHTMSMQVSESGDELVNFPETRHEHETV